MAGEAKEESVPWEGLVTNSDKHAIGPDTDSGGGKAGALAGCQPVPQAATLPHRMYGCRPRPGAYAETDAPH